MKNRRSYTRTKSQSGTFGGETVTFPVTTLSDPQGRVTRCHNFRPDPSGQGLRGVGSPVEVFPETLPGAVFVPGGEFHHTDGKISLLLCRDTELIVVKGDEKVSLGRYYSKASCAVAMDDGWIVMTGDKALRFRFSEGTWSEGSPAGDMPPMMFERMDGNVFSTTTARLDTNDFYNTRSGSLSMADSESVGDILSDTYLHIASLAMAARQFIQPVVARYRLRGPRGETLYTSAPVLVAPENGPQMTYTDLPAEGDSLNRFGPATVTVKGFTLGLRLTRTPSEAWRALVRNVEILVSPQLHPLMPGGKTHGSIRETNGGKYCLRAWMPGVVPSRRPGEFGGWMRDRVEGVLSHLEDVMKVVASAPFPGAGNNQIHVSPFDPDLYGPKDEINRLRRILSESVREEDCYGTVLRSLSAPHTFTAGAAARNGDTVMWGCLRGHSFPGYPLGELTSSVRLATGGATPCAVTVAMADGSLEVRESVMHGLHPEGISPLLAYPGGEARSMTILTPTVRATFPLTPARGGEWSFYLDPDCAKVALAEGTADGFAVPVSKPGVREWPDVVVMADAGSPLVPKSISYPGVSAVTALEAVPVAGSSPEMSRVKFYAFGTGGTALVTANSGREIASAAVLDRRGVTGPEATTALTGGVAVIAGGSPMILSGSRMRELYPGLRAKALGWNAPSGELWLFDTGQGPGTATVFVMDSCSLFTRTVERTLSTVSPASGLKMLTATGRLLDGGTEKDANVRAVHVSRIPFNRAPASHARLSVGLSGNVPSADIVLTPDNGSGADSHTPLLGVSLSGVLTHPFVPAFRTIHTHYLTLEVSALTGKPSQLTLR